VTAVADRFAGCALRAEWQDLDVIVEILNALSAAENMNHMHFPTGGGLDLESAKRSCEAGCLELDIQGLNIVKPSRLLLERFSGDDGAWTYFRLELAPLDPSGICTENTGPDEVLALLPEGNYAHRELLEDPARPSNARRVSRWLRGAFILMAKGSAYNQMSDTYDGRHSLGTITEERRPEVTGEEFRAHVALLLGRSARSPR
jgi:serine/threonine-protein kinase